MLNNSAYSKAVKTAGVLLYSLRVQARALLLCAYFMAVCGSGVREGASLRGQHPPGAAAHSPLIRSAPDVSGDIINTQACMHARRLRSQLLSAKLCAQKHKQATACTRAH